MKLWLTEQTYNLSRNSVTPYILISMGFFRCEMWCLKMSKYTEDIAKLESGVFCLADFLSKYGKNNSLDQGE
jgi:hypothetical protein